MGHTDWADLTEDWRDMFEEKPKRRKKPKWMLEDEYMDDYYETKGK